MKAQRWNLCPVCRAVVARAPFSQSGTVLVCPDGHALVVRRVGPVELELADVDTMGEP